MQKSEPEPRQLAAQLVKVSDVKREKLRWLWPRRVPEGKLTCWAGDPSLGKSFCTLDAAARVSNGTPWPDTQNVPNPAGKVLLLSAEDDVYDTIAPRLDAAGAKGENVLILQAVKSINPESGESADEPFSLPAHVGILDAVLRQHPDIRLVVIDPITAFLHDSDSHNNASVRQALAPLAALASEHRVAIIIVQHLNKSAGGSAMYRVSGSLAFVAASRQAWLFARDKENPTRRLMVSLKCNLSAEPEGLAYEIAPSQDDPDIGVVQWHTEKVNVSADDALDASDESTERDEAAAWLREILEAGPIEAKAGDKAARAAGIKDATLRRAKKKAKVTSRRSGFGPGAIWYWCLPGQAPTPPHAEVSAYAAYTSTHIINERESEHLCGRGEHLTALEDVIGDEGAQGGNGECRDE